MALASNPARARARCQLFQLRLELRKPLRIDKTDIRFRDVGILRYEDASGRIGYGEVSPLPELTTDFSRPLRWGLACAREMARESAESFRTEVHGLIPRLPADEAVSRAQEYARAGYTHVKIKVGDHTPAENLGLMMKEIVSTTPLKLRLDANGKLAYPVAVSIARDFAPRIDYFEDPFAISGDDTLEKFFYETGVPYAVDLREGLVPARGPGLKACVIKPTLLGEIPFRSQAILSSSYESPLGLYQIARAGRGIRGPHGLDTADIFEKSLFEIIRGAGELDFPSQESIRLSLDRICASLSPSAEVKLED